MEEDDDERSFCAQLEGMEKEFSLQTTLLHKATSELQEARGENICLKERVGLLTAENKRLMQIVSNSNKMLSGHVDYATQNVQMQKQLDYLASQLGEEKENNSRAITEMRVNNKVMQKELDYLKSIEKDRASALNSEIEATGHKCDEIIAEKEQLLTELQREIKFQCQQRNNMEIHFSEQLSSLNRTIVEKNQELQHVRREYSDFAQSHEQQLQKQRMKYEENLLNVVQASNNETQLESCRRKMLIQKQEAENEIASLKKKIMQFEGKQRSHPSHGHRTQPNKQAVGSLDFFE